MAVELLPAIDLIAGKVVRLYQGRRDLMDVYSDDPAAVAGSFLDQGARWVHVVDLSAAFQEDLYSRAANEAAIRDLCIIPGLSVDTGGGVRDLGRVEHLLDLGCDRVAMGTPLVRDPAMARRAVAEFGDAMVADVAARDGMVRVDGWRSEEALTAEDLVGEVARWGFRHLVFTDVARDGTSVGIDGCVYEGISRCTGFPVIASGGISTARDIERLAELGGDVIEGVIVGRALYEGTLSVAEALAILDGRE